MFWSTSPPSRCRPHQPSWMAGTSCTQRRWLEGSRPQHALGEAVVSQGQYEPGTEVLEVPWAQLREQGADLSAVAVTGVTLDADYRTRLLPLVHALENGTDVPRYHPVRLSLVARLPQDWTRPRAQRLERLIDRLGLATVVCVAALRSWPRLAHLTLAMLPSEPSATATVGLTSLPVTFDGLFLGSRRTVGRGYAVARLATEEARVLASLRQDLGSTPPRPLMSGMLHLRRDVQGGSDEASRLSQLLKEADQLLRAELRLTDFVWNATQDDMILTARQRTARLSLPATDPTAAGTS